MVDSVGVILIELHEALLDVQNVANVQLEWRYETISYESLVTSDSTDKNPRWSNEKYEFALQDSQSGLI